jgi:MerR family transcriptional regulator, thiopeptide resistance regulator
VKEVARMSGVSVRTLYYYDEIGLLKPAFYGENGYRYYEKEQILRLQQIMFFRELDFKLDDIQHHQDLTSALGARLTGGKRILISANSMTLTIRIWPNICAMP